MKMTDFNDRTGDDTDAQIDPDTLRLVQRNLEPMKTVDIELRDRLSEVESAISDLNVEKDMVNARLHEAMTEHRKLHRLVAVLNRMDAKADDE